MYDARGRGRLGNQSGMLFGLLTIGVIAAAFFGVLLMPGGSGSPTPSAATAATASDTELLTILDDRATRNYVQTLGRVSPRSARQLEADVSAAIEDGADKDELAVLVMGSMQEDMLSELKYLAKADIRHVDAIMASSKQGLRKLSSQNSKWCKGSTYEAFADMSPAQIEAKLRREFGYDSGAYSWGLQMNTVFLEAIEDGKQNPKSYGKMTSQDNVAVQRTFARLISDPQIMQLMTLQGQGEAAALRAMRNFDFCRLGVTGIDTMQSIPKATRERMWAEAFSEMDFDDLEKIMKMSRF